SDSYARRLFEGTAFPVSSITRRRKEALTSIRMDAKRDKRLTPWYHVSGIAPAWRQKTGIEWNYFWKLWIKLLWI
ncbi:MAG: hypothetical protein KJ052_22160, partial [Candidatus Hydrogenedentes bacterium]|nr:hypothetical protein [Candidatus Hydrogenedentota bacterium]